MEQRVISSFRKKIEEREYVLSFPADAHIQEMWDFVQEVANHLIEVNKKNMEAMEKVEPSEVITPEIVEA